jgi:SNF family Na+-dependent transporter
MKFYRIIVSMPTGLGIAMVIIASYIVCYYNVIIAWSMFYWFASMTSQLPWQYCDNWWNTETCLDVTSECWHFIGHQI